MVATITCLGGTKGWHPWDDPLERGGACQGNSTLEDHRASTMHYAFIDFDYAHCPRL